jgi:uncharacterized membrane protein (UPF0182 family)
MRGPARPSRIRTLAAIALGVLFLLFLFGSGIANIYTDWLWFDALDRGDVWWTTLGTQLGLAGAFIALFFVVLWGNLTLADRLAPEVRPVSPEDEMIERYHEIVGSQAGKLRIGVASLVALGAGASTSQQWRTWLLFRNGEDFGVSDPLFGLDASFYVFRLPFWTFLVDRLFTLFVFALFLSIAAHYLNGGIRAAVPANRVTSGVKLHLSVLLAILAILRAISYWLDRYHLVTSTRGLYDGALTTDVEVQLPALQLLVLVSLLGAALFLYNIRRPGWTLPVVTVGLWAVSHVVVATIFPALFQRLIVEPEQSQREQQYIGDNIEATRYAYGLDDSKLTSVEFGYEAGLTEAQLEANADVFGDVVLLDPSLADDAFNRSESGRESYQFNDELDLDRYVIDGDLEPVAIAVRSLNLGALADDWERQHIALTHGYGVAMAAADDAVGGLPDYLVSGIGPSQAVAEGLAVELERPQVYYDEDFDGYAIVGATRDEIDYVADTSAAFRYDGEGGVNMSGFFRRLAFSLRFQQLDPLISPFIQDGSRVIYNRDIESRVRELAPFLDYDSDPYPVLDQGRIFWIIDAYTTTGDFPYAQSVDVGSLQPSDDLARGYNYVRNSVKVVIDAYDGDVAFYIVDDEDPLIRAWQSAYPSLFQPVAEAPAGVQEHFRYPTDIFKVQTETWDTYQVDDPIRFLEGALAWRVATQPTAEGASDAGPGITTSASTRFMEPQYRTTRLPGETEPEFVLQRAFVPSSSSARSGRPELTSIMVARSDPGRYGELVQYRIASGNLSAPALVDSDIRRDDVISPFISLRNREGSSVQFGEMQMVVLEGTVVYVRPLYIEADTETAVPELTQVIAVSGGRIAMAPTLEEALARVTVDGDAPPVAPPEPGDGEEPDPPLTGAELSGLTVAELLQRAQDLLDDADRVEASDPDTAAELRAEALAALEALSNTLGVASSDGEQESSGA